MKESESNSDFKAERYETHEFAQIEVYGRMGRLTAKMRNLSLTGAFFEIVRSDYFPQKGDMLRVTIPLRQVGKTHVIDGEIVWTRAMGFGLQFMKRQEVINRMLHLNKSPAKEAA